MYGRQAAASSEGAAPLSGQFQKQNLTASQNQQPIASREQDDQDADDHTQEQKDEEERRPCVLCPLLRIPEGQSEGEEDDHVEVSEDETKQDRAPEGVLHHQDE